MTTFELVMVIEVGIIALCQLFGAGPWRRG
jgi:hypothetical protein